MNLSLLLGVVRQVTLSWYSCFLFGFAHPGFFFFFFDSSFSHFEMLVFLKILHLSFLSTFHTLFHWSGLSYPLVLLSSLTIFLNLWCGSRSFSWALPCKSNVLPGISDRLKTELFTLTILQIYPFSHVPSLRKHHYHQPHQVKQIQVVFLDISFPIFSSSPNSYSEFLNPCSSSG